MLEYKCDKCNKEFDRKSNYERHLNRLKSCIKQNNDNNCVYCNKIFSTNGNLIKHLKLGRCKNKIEDDINQMKLEIENLKNNNNIFNVLF